MSACTSRFDSTEKAELARRLVALTEGGLPLVEDPWGWLAQRLEINVEATLELLQRLQAEGAIRRVAAVPNHYRLGYRHNGMTVWDVDDAEIARLGPLIGALAAGNRVMLKMSESTPVTGQLLKDLLAQIFPEDQVAVVLGEADVGLSLIHI